jgi:hypothetical protein
MRSRLSRNLSRRGKSLDLQTPHIRSRVKVAATHIEREQDEMATLGKTIPSRNTTREMRIRRKRANGVSTIKSIGTTLKNVSLGNTHDRA